MTRDVTRGENLTKEEAVQKALELRKQRKSYREIGRELKVSHVIAFKYVKEALAELKAETREIADDLRELEAESLDKLESKLWEDFDSSFKDKRYLIALSILKIKEKRAKLFGLDVAADLTVGLSDEYAEIIKNVWNNANNPKTD